MIKQSMLQHIESGNWMVGQISDHLIRQFKKFQIPLGIEPRITARSLSHYRKVDLIDCFFNSKSKGLIDLSVSERLLIV